jgi:uncharacterized repeat protein (TIGR01451 family)
MRKTIIVCLVFCIAMSIAVASASALANSGGGTWQYQKEITIHENSGELLTDYQVLVKLSGGDFPTEVQPDGGDIRFTADDGTELNYWIEEYDYSGKHAKIWVKVPEIPANGKVMITMSYGNPNANSASDGDATFEFFDDFEEGRLDKWQVVAANWGIVTEHGNNVVKGSGGENTHHGLAWKHTISLTPGIEIRAKVKNTDPYGVKPGRVDPGLYWGDASLVGSGYKALPGYAAVVDNKKHGLRVVKSDGSETYLISTPITAMDSTKYYTYIFRIYNDGTLVSKIFDGDDEVYSISSQDFTYISTAKYPGFFADFDGKAGYLDDFIVRKCVFLEPTISIEPMPLTPEKNTLTLTKSVTPSTIQESEATTITIEVENKGSVDAKNVEIMDSIPAEFTLVSGSMTQSYDLLKPNEPSTYQYTIKATETGRFVTDVASATYEDEKGNSYSSPSNSVSITVDGGTPPTPTPTPTPSTPTPTPSIPPPRIEKPQLTISHTTLVEPKIGEETLITVSIENTGNGEAKNIKLRERIPSGLSIDYVEGADSTGNLISWDGDLKPAQTHSIKHSIKVLTAGDKIIPVEVTYEGIADKEHITLTTSSTIIIKPVSPAPTITPTPTEESDIPWLYIIILVAVVLGGIAIIVAVRRKGEGGAEVTIEENTKGKSE